MKSQTLFLSIALLAIKLSSAQVTEFNMVNCPTDQIVNSENGINLYESLNIQLGGKAARYDENNQPVQGWVEDYFENGKLLHKGYYVDGKLKSYKNYYDNGQMERKFAPAMLSWSKSNMKTYYMNGNLRTKTAYYRSKPNKAEGYYASGQPKYNDQYNKTGRYFIMTKSYYEDGKLKSVFKMVDKGSMLYNKIEYYANGSIKEEGFMKMDKKTFVYKKEGVWKVYNENGQLAAQKSYKDGKSEGAEDRNW